MNFGHKIFETKSKYKSIMNKKCSQIKSDSQNILGAPSGSYGPPSTSYSPPAPSSSYGAPQQSSGFGNANLMYVTFSIN